MRKIRSVAVVGAGTMGTGIAQLALQSGYTVYMQDVGDPILNRAHAKISRALEKKDLSMLLARLHFRGTLAELLSADCAIEAVSEDLALKQKVFKELDRVLGPDCLLATNTSALSVAAVASAAKHPERVVGLHFFNPPPSMMLVELVPTKAASVEAVELAGALARTLGKTVVRAEDRPGFIANRVTRPFYLAAMRRLEAGEGTPSAIDAAARAAGFRMGPFELMDLIGLDVNLSTTKAVYEGLERPASLAPARIQEELLRRGFRGRKGGAGFYAYSEVDGPSENPALKEILPGLGAQALDPAGAVRGMVQGVIDECNRAYAEGVASREDIDTVLKIGMNWPKGPFEWEKEYKSRG